MSDRDDDRPDDHETSTDDPSADDAPLEDTGPVTDHEPPEPSGDEPSPVGEVFRSGS